MENLEELAGHLELVIGVNSHPCHVDVAQFGCDQVLHCVHVIFVAVDNALRSGSSAHEFAVLALPRYSSNTPRSGLSAHEPAVLALPRYSTHQNVIA